MNKQIWKIRMILVWRLCRSMVNAVQITLALIHHTDSMPTFNNKYGALGSHTSEPHLSSHNLWDHTRGNVVCILVSRCNLHESIISQAAGQQETLCQQQCQAIKISKGISKALVCTSACQLVNPVALSLSMIVYSQ